jgi:acetyl esterase/lipase
MSRRSMLTTLTAAATGLLAACAGPGGATPAAQPGTPEPRPLPYGPDPSQYAVLHLPPSDGGDGPLPVVVVLHGGYWRAQYGLELGTPLAVDLTNAGVAALNVEYRRIGSGGGFPTTLADVAAAVDLLAGSVGDLGRMLDLDRVVMLGHSAGGQLAAWAASRTRLPAGAPGAGPRVLARGVVAQAGVLDLVAAADQGLGAGAVVDLLGGPPTAQAGRYAIASPAALVPAPCPVVAVHGTADTTVPPDQSRRYVAAALAAHGQARLRMIDGADHFRLIDPTDPAWFAVRDEVLGLLR